MINAVKHYDGLRRRKEFAGTHPTFMHDLNCNDSSKTSDIPACPQIEKGMKESTLIDLLAAAAEVCEKSDMPPKSGHHLLTNTAQVQPKSEQPSIRIRLAKTPEPSVLIQVATARCPSSEASDTLKRKATSED